MEIFTMSSNDSVSDWVRKLEKGERAGVQKLWDRYFQRLVGFARKKLQAVPRRAADEEDVALSAFNSFCRAAEQGRFSKLEDRDNLWALLVVITARKAFKLRMRTRSDVLDEAALDRAEARRRELEQIIDGDPTPEFAAEVAEECDRLLASLSDQDLRVVALLKMDNYTNKEISDRLNRSERAIERKLKIIRSQWSKDDLVT
jgi:DNA-directed RNA polymerase specialized sigma24 family protein